MDWSKYYPANYTAITPEDIEMIKELKQNPPVEEDASNDKSDDGEGMDKVDPKAVKKKFKDRKDKDLDNDGDEDDDFHDWADEQPKWVQIPTMTKYSGLSER